MAQVKTQPQQNIDWQLDWAVAQWRRLPKVAAEIDEWDLVDRLHFTEEWPLEEERLLRLDRHAREGALTAPQLTCYRELKRLVAQHRPILVQLLADDASDTPAAT